MWGLTGDASACAKPASFSTRIPNSIMSKETVEKYVKMSGSNENKEKVKNESVAITEGDILGFGFPLMVVKRGDGKVAKFFGSE